MGTPLYTPMAGTARLRCALCPNAILDTDYARRTHFQKHERDGHAVKDATRYPLVYLVKPGVQTYEDRFGHLRAVDANELDLRNTPPEAA